RSQRGGSSIELGRGPGAAPNTACLPHLQPAMHPDGKSHWPRDRLGRRFFFSSRRRHTRFDCDWSSDVCSSDLRAEAGGVSAVSAPLRVRRIQRSRRRVQLNLRELWAYRELLFFLIWRDVKVKYKQTALGAAWAIIVPFLTTIVLTLVFNRGLHLHSEYHVPYPLFLFTAMLPWTYFTACLSASSTSIVGNQNLITKVFFPRLIIPLGSVVAPVIDFLCAFTVLVGMFLWYGRSPHWHAVVIPVFLGMALLTAFGVGLWLSALNVRYRDVPYVLPFLIQIWFFV